MVYFAEVTLEAAELSKCELRENRAFPAQLSLL
jgi:hypothetical protein